MLQIQMQINYMSKRGTCPALICVLSLRFMCVFSISVSNKKEIYMQ
jgi:hypothetical protein